MNKVKQLLPRRFKHFLWFILKSPQRKVVGCSTLFTDFKGLLSRTFNRTIEGDITLCIGLRNRSKPFINYVIQSLNEVDCKEGFALSVFDCGSTDVVNLEEIIREKWKGKLVFEREDRNFERAYSFNKAVANVDTELLFVCDADMKLPKDLYALIKRNVKKNSAWFPISYHLDENSSKGKFKTEGKGIFAATKTHLNKVGTYNEAFTEWGNEDWELFFRFYKNGIAPHRTFQRDLEHQYHPTLRPDKYESYYKKYGF